MLGYNILTSVRLGYRDDPRVKRTLGLLLATKRANAWEILYALSVMGHGKDRHLKRAWTHLRSMADERGASILVRTPVQCPWKVGKRDEANRWLTFYAALAEKHR